jgi:D-3-phosphoglycerate dehydrogenase
MSRTVVIGDTEASEKAGVHELLESGGQDLTVRSPDDFEWTPAEIIEHGSDTDVVATALSKVTSDVITELDDLAYIVKTGVGIDNIDVDAATDAGILVSRTPGVNDEGVAEHVFGFAIALNKRLIDSHRELQNGNWAFRAEITGETHELLDKTIGIVGLGTIGQRLAEIANAVGMDVLAYDPFVDADEMAEHGAKKVALEELLTQSRYVSINALLTEDTRHMIGSKEFESMRQDAYLINTSRGPIVDETALIDALENGKIEGAGLDVFESEPPDSKNPLFDRDDVIVSPHVSGTTKEGYRRIGETASDDILAFYRGELPPEDHIVNPDVLDGYDHPFL